MPFGIKRPQLYSFLQIECWQGYVHRYIAYPRIFHGVTIRTAEDEQGVIFKLQYKFTCTVTVRTWIKCMPAEHEKIDVDVPTPPHI